MTKPTPTPWTSDGYDVRRPNGRYIAYTGPKHTPRHLYPPACKAEDEANAKFIVRACNSHDALVDASRNLADLAERNTDDGDEWQAAIEAVRAAITAATRKGSA